MPEEKFQRENKSNQGKSEKMRERFSGEEPVSVGMPWRLMVFSFVLLAFSVFIFFGLRFGYSVYLDSQMSALDEKVEQLSTKVSKGKQKRFLGFYSQLSNLEKVLNRKGFSQNVFGFLEKNTLPSVYYKQGEYSSDTNEFKMSGSADSMKDLVKQMTIFGEASEISSVKLNSVNLARGKVGFEINLVFNPGYFDEPK